ncbi:uncharacterized protein SOCE26_030990 [Sorangium cellulosum]|uniref:Uncharacterized protein n=1 Tax=Sorangium cellulosum TaxID=56 RepID=A0A2L0EQT9_SORCE|nr:hypothetical protein [Sorangium cellulosum]AUX41677.1 uncharacterized protein SOCE26_030990 [Sorangium cellulosum]
MRRVQEQNFVAGPPAAGAERRRVSRPAPAAAEWARRAIAWHNAPVDARRDLSGSSDGAW